VFEIDIAKYTLDLVRVQEVRGTRMTLYHQMELQAIHLLLVYGGHVNSLGKNRYHSEKHY
jgi:hypothetical protein